jgi:hypothetical protein
MKSFVLSAAVAIAASTSFEEYCTQFGKSYGAEESGARKARFEATLAEVRSPDLLACSMHYRN